jgi:hypothetical protein
MNKTCDRCQTSFDCSGCTTGACWCMDYPAIFSCSTTDAANGAKDCVCPQCLTAMTQAHIAQTIDQHIIHTTAPAEALACQGLPLIERLDYTIENGLWIFSRWFFLKRGECCGNACRNCPYGHVNVRK